MARTGKAFDPYPDVSAVVRAHTARCAHPLRGTVRAAGSVTYVGVACETCTLPPVVLESNVVASARANNVIATQAGCVQWFRDCLQDDIPGVEWEEDLDAEWRLRDDPDRLYGRTRRVSGCNGWRRDDA